MLKDEFFETNEFGAAFESWHIGKVFKAYRTHPRHLKMYGKALNQELLGRWLGLNQGQVSNLERAPKAPDLTIETLQRYAIILHLPQHLLWFDLPGQSRLSPPQRRSGSERIFRTLLEQKIKERRQTFEEFAEFAEVFARKHGEPGTISVRHLQRLVAGRGAGGEPLGNVRPANARLLERIFGVSVEVLLSPPPEAATDHHKNEHEATARTATELMESGDSVQVAANFSPAAVDAFAKVSLAVEPGEFLNQISIETPVPGRIGWSDVEHIRSTTRAVATAENVFGGGLSCEAAMGQLRWAGKLLDARADNDVRRAMFEAVGNLSSVVAYSAFDVSAYEAADRCFHLALWCSDQGGSWALRANTLAEMSRKAAYLGDLDDALSMIEFAQVRSDRLTNTARAMLSTLRARLLALTSRHSEARSDITRADAYFHESTDELNPPWLTYYDIAEHQGSIGKALIPIAQADQNVDIAAPRLRDAIELHRENYPRSRAFSRTRLATLAMDIGDPHEAVAIGRQLLDEVAPLRSDRVTSELRGLARVSDRYSQIGDVKDLRHDILALTPSKDQRDRSQ